MSNIICKSRIIKALSDRAVILVIGVDLEKKGAINKHGNLR
jgi:hypothetical protein